MDKYVSPVNGSVYWLKPDEKNTCTGCAFLNDADNCARQTLCFSGPDKPSYIFVPCNESPAPVDPLVKPTNPKDSIGIRKAPMSTVSAAVMAEIGVAMLEGAAKYGRHNYREAGVRGSVYYDATMRHLMAWWEGEDIDPDSGMSHITKAITSLVVYRDAMIQGMAEDDRPPKSADFYKELNKKAGEILDKYADKKPKHVTENNIERKST